MTRTSGSRRDSAAPNSFDDVMLDALKVRERRIAEIIDGALPSTDELLCGYPPRGDSVQSDLMAYVDFWSQRRPENILFADELFIAAENARVTADVDNLVALREAALQSSDYCYQDLQLVERVDVLIALLGEGEATGRVMLQAVKRRARGRASDLDVIHAVAFAIGVSTTSGDGHYEAGDAAKNLKFGFRILGNFASVIGDLASLNGGGKSLASLGKRPSAASDDDWELETAASLDAIFGDVKEDDEDAPGLIVVPVMPAGVGGQKEARKSWQGLAGRSLPVVDRGDVAGHRNALVARYPHAVDVIDTILSDLAPREDVRFRPTLLVGAPGSGKTSLLRAIADQVGLPCEINSLAGATDSSAMGTSAQWSTVRESIPLQLIKRSGSASVAIIWDEIEKASESRNNGSILDALLPMLEIDQARRYRDLALEVEVDLSAVTHFATANDLDRVPAPLRDRFRILTMPEPGWEHLGTLTRQIVDRIAKERGVDSRFFGGLAEDEMDLVRQAWPGGSIRQLTRVVTTIIEGRDQLMARC